MIRELFGAIKDFLKEYMSHRLFPLTIVFFILCGILIYRLFMRYPILLHLETANSWKAKLQS